jgi:uncharacterized protein (DUF2235 family)
MPKTIILCSDGTGNSGIKGRGTNVFKVFEAIDLNDHRTNPAFDTQLAFYDDGVGTKGAIFLRILGGAAGYGLKRNVKELYKELSRVYDEGDRVMLFGFSRGAFTVRTLAGMIGTCGVLKGEAFKTARELREAVELAYKAYRCGYRSQLTSAWRRLRGWHSDEHARRHFEEQYLGAEPTGDRVHRNVRIWFIGVWDTVDAVGLPFAIASFVNRWIYQFKFSTEQLGPHVDGACQALSIDDPRLEFKPVLWWADPRIQQVWFAGVHSNVGGGYPKQGMSLVALDWMLAHAERAGLRLQRADRELFRGHATVDDLLYNPRTRFGIFYRWAPRDIRRYCETARIAEPAIHLSVAERIAHATDDYAPGNIPPGCKVVHTLSDKEDPQRDKKDALLKMRAGAAELALRRVLKDRYLLDEMRGAVDLGVYSYWIFMTSWGTLILAAASVLTWLVVGSASWRDSALALLAASVLGFVCAWRLSRRADAAMEDQFSLFWQQHQRELRTALKQSKVDARAAFTVA